MVIFTLALTSRLFIVHLIMPRSWHEVEINVTVVPSIYRGAYGGMDRMAGLSHRYKSTTINPIIMELHYQRGLPAFFLVTDLSVCL